MLKRLYSAIGLAVLLCSAVVVTAARPASRELVAQLPPVDMIVTMDLQRLQSQTLPAFGALNPKMMAEINRALAEAQRESGLDPNTFETLVVGAGKLNKGPDNLVMLIQGRFTAAEAIESGFAAAQRKNAKISRETREYEGFTVFLLKAGRTSAKGQPVVAKQQWAVTALDGNTLAVGTFPMVQKAIEARLGRARVDDELVGLATRTPDALIGIGGVVPPEMLAGLTGTNDKQLAMLRGARRFAGSFNATGLDLSGAFSLIMETPAQANDIASALNGLRLMFGSHFIMKGGKNTPPQMEILRKVVNEAQILAQDNEVKLQATLREPEVRQLMALSH